MLMVLPVYSQDKRYHGDGIDDVLRFVPTIAVFGLKACGVEAESTWQRRIGAQVLAFGVNAAVTYSLKHAIHEKRPDGTDNHSFPSGHTSVAFSGATVLMHEYRKVSPWIGVAGYAVATTVAVDRVRRNRHHWGMSWLVPPLVWLLLRLAICWVTGFWERKRRKQRRWMGSWK